MMCIFTAQIINMQRDERMIDKALEKFVRQIHVKLANHGALERHLKFQSGAAGQIKDYARQGLIQRNIRVAITTHTFFVADRFGKGLPERNANIFNCVVAINMQIAIGLNFQINHAVAGYLIQHMIEKGYARVQRLLARAIKIEFHADLSFQRGAINFSDSHDRQVRVEAESNRDNTALAKTIRVAMIPSAFNLLCFEICQISAMSRFWSRVVQDLVPYVPGEQPKIANLIKLNTNENPYSPSPKVLAAIAQANTDLLRLYPDPNADALRQAIATTHAAHGIRPQQVFVGNGSDEVLALVFQGLLKHDRPLLFPDITYSFYPVYCALYGIEYRTVPLTTALAIDIDDYHPERQPAGGVIFPNPNAPTGRLLPLAEIERLVQQQPEAVVVIDEAYIDFGGESAIALVNRYPNLLVVQTLSKSRALAGLRVGFAVGHVALIEALDRIKNSFNSYPLDRLALAGATAAFNDAGYFENLCKKIIASRERLSTQMQALGFEVVPSAANFIFVYHPQRSAVQLAAYLRERSILVRHFKLPRIEQYLRITIGTDAQCAALLEALLDA